MAILKIRDDNGNVQEVLAIKGEKGDSYVLTEADKREIANMIAAGAVATTGLDTDDYALKTDVPDVSGFALKTDIPTVPTKVSAFANDAGYLTKTQVQAMIDNAIAKLQKEAVIIGFSIEDFQFQAEEGMTWREWVNSEYNTDGACVYNAGSDTVRFVEYSLDVLSPSNAPVKGSDTIISGYFYYLS